MAADDDGGDGYAAIEPIDAYGGGGGGAGGATGSTFGLHKTLTISDIPRLMHMLNTDNEKLRLEIVISFRKMLSREEAPPIDVLIEHGVVPTFIRFLEFYDQPKLQFEAAWALTNIASGTSQNTVAVFDAGAVPLCVKLLESADVDVREQAVWLLGNIAGA